MARLGATPFIPGDVKSFDFYFVANEASKTYNLTTALQSVTERIQLYSSSGLMQIPWQPEFLPKLAEGGSGEEVLIPMTATCPNVSIDAIKRMLGQGTKADPYRFLAENGKRRPVRLTRVLARVDITIPNVIANKVLGNPKSDQVLVLDYIDDFEMALTMCHATSPSLPRATTTRTSGPPRSTVLSTITTTPILRTDRTATT